MTTKIPAELSSTPGIIDTSNATAITIDSSEEVGIGSTSPTAKLEVLASSNSTYFKAGGDDTGNNGRALNFTSSTSTSFNGAIHTINAPSTQGEIAFATTNSERARVTANGITFNGDTAAANALDDYEEGQYDLAYSGQLWTIHGTYTKGNYTKIGNICTVNGLVMASAATTSTQDLRISVPFTAAAQQSNATNSGTGSCMSNTINFNSGYTSLIPFISNGSTHMRFFQFGDNIGWKALEENQLPVGSTYAIYFSATYRTA